MVLPAMFLCNMVVGSSPKVKISQRVAPKLHTSDLCVNFRLMRHSGAYLGKRSRSTVQSPSTTNKHPVVLSGGSPVDGQVLLVLALVVVLVLESQPRQPKV